MLEEDVRRTWKIPYVAIDSLTAEPGMQHYEPPPEPAAQTANNIFKVGDNVTRRPWKSIRANSTETSGRSPSRRPCAS